MTDDPASADTETGRADVERAVSALRALLDAARRVVVFTGAGISTESGIPDFRSPGGIWSTTTPVQYDEFVASEAARREAWRRKFIVDRDITAATPNRGHRAIAALVASGKASSVITQNIDGLHQASGIADEQIIELHGNTTYARCLDCAHRHELAPIRAAFERDGTLPACERCGGLVKTATISFGQAMPAAQMQRAQVEVEACDLLVAAGSSLVVYPAAGFPAHAKRHGAALAIINRDPTDLDGLADLVAHTELGPTLGEATGV